nr:protein PIN-LIKES 6-like isoform X2 [Physcomitrium patens]|eukprot:XP_024396348.1 protein PIN-LIKES 6-like isoform X2 [Physcomitrella patens]
MNSNVYTELVTVARVYQQFEESATTLLQFAVVPVLKILILCAFGLGLASSYVNILPAQCRKLLSKLVFALFLPCLIFTQLGKAVTLQSIIEWWFIPINVVLGASFGCALGYLVALIVRPPPQYFNFTVVMIGIGNIGNIPLVIIASICRDESNPFGLDPTVCNTNGVAYISFGQWVGAVIVYTFAFHMLAPPKTVPTNDEKALVIKVEGDKDVNELSNGTASNVNDTDSLHVSLLRSCQPTKLQKVRQGVARKWRWLAKSSLLKDICQPPVVSSLLALIIGATPTLKELFFEEHSVFFFFTDSLNMLGGAMVPCIMLVLGGNLIGGLTIVQTANHLGFLPANNKLFRFVLLLQHSMPTSILAGAVASLRGHGAKEASAILFWEHILAIFSIAIWLILYINVLF